MLTGVLMLAAIQLGPSGFVLEDAPFLGRAASMVAFQGDSKEAVLKKRRREVKEAIEAHGKTASIEKELTSDHYTTLLRRIPELEKRTNQGDYGASLQLLKISSSFRWAGPLRAP